MDDASADSAASDLRTIPLIAVDRSAAGKFAHRHETSVIEMK
jgi:hypothetical protein